jgi:acyl dehydratase
MADLSAVGKTDERATMPVDRSKIREFARACKTSNPEYLDDERAPCEPTFLMTTAFWASGTPALAMVGFDLRRVLHGGQEFVFHGPPPHAGDRLTFQTRVDKAYEKEGRRGGTMAFAELVTEFRDPEGTLVAEARTTVIETGQAPQKD